MQRTGKQHPPALDVQGQRMFCAGRRERTVGAAKLPSKIAGTTWTVLTQFFPGTGRVTGESLDS